jgi:hypothetical protein
VLIPVELRYVFWPTMLAAGLLGLAAGWMFGLGMLAAVVAGVAVFPILLPYLPTREFTSKGLILGAVAAAPFVWWLHEAGSGWAAVARPIALALMGMAVTAFLALNFTGSTPFTSRTGVKREIARYTRLLAAMFGGGILLVIALVVARIFGGG